MAEVRPENWLISSLSPNKAGRRREELPISCPLNRLAGCPCGAVPTPQADVDNVGRHASQERAKFLSTRADGGGHGCHSAGAHVGATVSTTTSRPSDWSEASRQSRDRLQEGGLRKASPQQRYCHRNGLTTWLEKSLRVLKPGEHDCISDRTGIASVFAKHRRVVGLRTSLDHGPLE